MKHGKTPRENINGIRLNILNTAMIVLSCILYVWLILISGSISEKNDLLVQETNEYIDCEGAAQAMRNASQYLTDQVRFYTQTQDTAYVDLYFEEANETRSREKALETVSKCAPNGNAPEEFAAALQCSYDLMQSETYAMKLAAVGSGCDLSTLPEAVRNVKLSEEDAALAPSAMIEKARYLMFDTVYRETKLEINTHLSRFSNDLQEEISARQDEISASLRSTLRLQRVLLFISLVLTVLDLASIGYLVIKPLKVHIQHIRQNRTLDVIGGYELKYLAQTYNDVYRLNAEHESFLIQKAEHDPLTGALNRTAFDKLRTTLTDDVPIALLFLDIDYFKQVNDSYGHAAGDRVLQSVASLLQSSVRSTDYVIRLGGDEFAVLMVEIPREDLYVIRRKLERINQFLKNPADDELPSTSVSAGVAFSENGLTEDLFTEADRALYRAKDNGRGSCCFDSSCDIPASAGSEV